MIYYEDQHSQLINNHLSNESAIDYYFENESAEN